VDTGEIHDHYIVRRDTRLSTIIAEKELSDLSMALPALALPSNATCNDDGDHSVAPELVLRTHRPPGQTAFFDFRRPGA